MALDQCLILSDNFLLMRLPDTAEAAAEGDREAAGYHYEPSQFTGKHGLRESNTLLGHRLLRWVARSLTKKGVCPSFGVVCVSRCLPQRHPVCGSHHLWGPQAEPRVLRDGEGGG